MALPVNASIDDEHPGRPMTGRAVLFWFLGFFGVVFAANFVLVREALSTFGGVETESSYQAGLEFRHESEAAALQAARNWRVDARLQQGAIEVSARDAAGLPIAGAELALTLRHPTDRRYDETLSPEPVGAGRWRASDAIAPGQWELVIELSRNGEREFRSTNRIVVK
ncbi:FixH family protein [Ancylobacter pratisalsi]|uniref:FixH family protein n=1 Tax=Ancylobacter pratisalsi TaxID=1745854 RepID=A0A6P1YM74_9HYPH|nr:FixH family protein [Ancylobacter pratisalsi]QIB34419.1 FixH family protein [Ancylobacter pratisalsi]